MWIKAKYFLPLLLFAFALAGVSCEREKACDHSLWSTPAEKAPSCTETGLEGGAVCELCDKMLEPQEELPAIGHAWRDGVCELCGALPPIGEEGNGLVFEENEDGSYTVTGIGYYADSHVVIPSEYKKKPVTGIADGAFESCQSMESVELPETLTYLGSHAFGSCNNLTEITVPSGVKSIGHYAFQNCKKLERVTLQEGVESIGDSAFRMSGVKEIVIPSTLVKIEEDAFDYCVVENVWISDLTAWCQISFENQYAQPMSASKLYLNNVQITELTIPAEITELSPYVFCGGDIDRVALHDGVESIGAYAFYNCGLKTLFLPDSIMEIGKYAFACNAFENAVIPSDMTALADGVFQNCENLTSVTLPKGLVRLEPFVFLNCAKLTEIVYLGSLEQWELVYKGYEWDHNVEKYTVRCTESE